MECDFGLKKNCRKIDRLGKLNIKQGDPNSDKQNPDILPHM